MNFENRTISSKVMPIISFLLFQIYYCEYYGKYLEEYERRRMMNVGPTDEALVDSSINSVTPLEASILMDDIMNNGMTFCSIM